MPIGNLAASLATQKEYVVPKVEQLALSGSRLWKKFKMNTKIKPVSNRPTRIPLQPLQWGNFAVANLDGGAFPQGSGPQTVPATISCVSFVLAAQWTALAEYTTDTDEKAVQDYAALLTSQQTEMISGCMDALVANSDGSNTLDTVVSVSGNTLTVNNPNAFLDGQTIDFYSNLIDLGGAFLGSGTILSVDAINVTVTLTGAPPSGVGAGTKMLVSGSPGYSNSGLNGLPALNVAGNTGTYMNIQRSAYPGKFNVPNFNAPNALTPSLVRAIEALMELSMGLEKADDAELTPHCNVDMMAAWENLSLQVQRQDVPNVRGESGDMLPRKRVRTIGGREALVNERAKPGRIDWVAFAHWFQVQSKPLSLYDVKGQVVFPAYGSGGTIATSMMMYMVVMPQFASVQPRLNAYLSSVPIPSKYFGK
jgi:hypothetical protein